MRPESRANATTVVVRTNVIVNKTVNLTVAMPGDLLTYTITFNNTNGTATLIWINDTLPIGVVYISDNASSIPYFFDRVIA